MARCLNTFAYHVWAQSENCWCGRLSWKHTMTLTMPHTMLITAILWHLHCAFKNHTFSFDHRDKTVLGTDWWQNRKQIAHICINCQLVTVINWVWLLISSGVFSLFGKHNVTWWGNKSLSENVIPIFTLSSYSSWNWYLLLNNFDDT